MLTRPKSVFSEIGTRAIENGLADPTISAFYEAIMSAPAGKTQEALKEFLPQLSLCSDKVSPLVPPPIFYVGRDSGQRHLFGDDWASPETSTTPLRTPDPDLERISAEAYMRALNDEPYYGYARTVVQAGSQSYEVAFERLIVTLRPSPVADYRICAYLGIIQDLQKTT
ncbi:hypothetical protein E1180_21135 [Roseibium denhamense]|uniref:Uncharacterized protein n=1 Tax=Roseibium denhamense TaxID=76305 RepID=A0ABY1NQC7_9HYPH|nr:hypothetical protein [Roseibium denhamense]MTI08010.1 hypothetical protein [Roseibium denhamense]SMP15582.1 hypothetical protein SAMN06265374_1596 [Roseibium denhamense]